MPEDEGARRRLRFGFGPLFDSLTHVSAVRGWDAAASLLATTREELPPTCEEVWSRGNVTFPRTSAEYLGVLGCSLSHLSAIRAAHELGLAAAVVMEDDIVPDMSQFWTSDLADFAAQLPADWGVVQLSHIGNSRMWKTLHKEWAAGRAPAGVLPSMVMWSTSAYLISARGMAAILAAYAPRGERFNLSGLECLNADVHLLKAPQAEGGWYTAAPPLLNFDDRPRGSTVHADRDVQDFGGMNKVHMRSYLHRLSKLYALDWSAQAWRRKRMNEGLESTRELAFGGAAAMQVAARAE
jgi:hypothetical protein